MGAESWSRPCHSQGKWHPPQCLSHEVSEERSDPLCMSPEIYSGVADMDITATVVTESSVW